MRKFSFILLVLITSLGAIAAPTVEGLLRGGSNPENIYDWSVFRLRVKKFKTVSIDEEGVVQEQKLNTAEIQDEEKNYDTKHIKLVLSTKVDEPIKFIQVEYSSPSMKKSNIVKVISGDDLLKKFGEETFQEKILLYGILTSLSSGNSSIINSMLTKFNKDYKSNTNLLSQEKLDLYEKYKKYLAALKEDPELEKTLESPLKPIDVTQLSEIQKLLKQDMYQDLNQVKITKEGNRFFWKASLENFEGIFTLDKHQLRVLNLTTPQGVINVGASQFRVFSSNFYLPGVIRLKDVIEENYEIEIKHYAQFGKTALSLSDLLKNYPLPEPKEEEKATEIEKVELTTETSQVEETIEITNNFNILMLE